MIFVDTCEVIRLGYRFDRPPLHTLLERRKRGQAFLAIPSVITKEWLVHAEQLVAQAFNHLKQARRSTEVLVQLGTPGGSQIASTLNEEAAKKAMKAAVERFIDSASIAKELFALKPYDAEEVLCWYFAGEPPFTDKKEKSQFPDAFAASAMCEWSRRHSIILNVVTNDSAMSAAFRRHGGHRVFQTLDAALADLARNVDPLYEEAEKKLRRSVNEVKPTIGWRLSQLKLATVEPYSARIVGIESIDLSIEPTLVTQEEPGRIEALVSISVSACVRYEAHRSDSSVPSLLTYLEHPERLAGVTTISARFVGQASIHSAAEMATFLMPPYPESDAPITVPLPSVR